MRPRLWLLAALVAATLARADTIETKDGQRLEGQVVAETPERLTLRGRYGELTVAKSDVVRRERDPERLELSDGSVVVGQVLRRTEAELVVRTAHGTLVIPAKEVAQAPRPPVDPQRLQALHREASRSHGAKDYRRAIQLYAELLALAPDDATALYNTACGHSLLGEKQAAVSLLERAVAAGFTDFGHIRADSDLDPLRAEPGYLALLADEAKWLRKAAAGATTRLLAQLKGRGCKADYRVFVDEERRIVYLHTKTQERLDAARKELDDYSRLQWRDLFRNRITQPLHIVLLTREDGPAMLERGIGGYFDPRTNVLMCGDIPSMAQARASVVTHEFTHALHFADQAARGQPHPIWLVEGLGSLFESARVVDDALVPRHGARLSTIKAAVRRDQALPWRRIMQLSHASFMEVADLAYAQSRYMCFYMWEKGLLKRFYDEYTQTSSFQGDRTALESFEIAFGRPIDEVERDWKAWVLKQEEPKVPFMGVRTEAAQDGCRVEVVVDGSGAANAGVKTGDVLTSADGTPLRAPDDVLEVLSTREVGDVVELELRRGEETLRLKVTLGGRQ
jgi:RNase P/RNase MRP subunit p29